MRILVDLNKCQLYAQCCFLAPEVFKLEGEEVLSYHPAPDEALRERVLRAAAACPVAAIMVEPEDAEAAP
ncbi:ferredoxin [Phenylobacterium sp.]|mgnify:CR=1 FL=1|uniref:ferredoxin n=1 Tax=Phenylobacterium sp. TaxID=1871053 RepID=UPI003BAC2867